MKIKGLLADMESERENQSTSPPLRVVLLIDCSRSIKEHHFGRVAAIADIYDALTSERPWRGAMPSSEALRLMTGEMREQLDQEFLHAFILCLEVEKPKVKAGLGALLSSVEGPGDPGKAENGNFYTTDV